MNDPMLNQLNQVVAEHLPSQVGDLLKKRLEKADSDSQSVARLNEEVRILRIEKDTSQEEVRKHAVLDKRLLDVQQKEREVDAKLLRQELSELKVAQAELRVKDMKEVVAMVFANNKFKYWESSNVQTPIPSGSFMQSVSSNKNVEGES